MKILLVNFKNFFREVIQILSEPMDEQKRYERYIKDEV